MGPRLLVLAATVLAAHAPAVRAAEASSPGLVPPLGYGALLLVGVLHLALWLRGGAGRGRAVPWSVTGLAFFALGALLTIAGPSPAALLAGGLLLGASPTLPALGLVRQLLHRGVELQAQVHGVERQVAERSAQLREANARLQRLASEDPLTGLATRESMERHLEHEWQRAMRNADPVAMLRCRIDDFEGFSRHFGGEHAERLLRTTGDVLQSSLQRAGDLAARLDEADFAVVLPATDLDGAMAVARTIRKAMRQRAVATAPGSSQPFVTLAIGLASIVPGVETPPERLLRDAERALVRAAGRGPDQLEHERA